MLYLKLILVYIIIPVFFYPLYFLISNSLDSLIGEQRLLYQLDFESTTQLLKVFFNDWLASLPVMYGLLFVLILPVFFFSRNTRISPTLMAITACGIIALPVSTLLGFRGAELLVNSLSILIFASLYIGSKKWLLENSTRHKRLARRRRF